MKLINQTGLQRGDILLDYAFSEKGAGLELGIPDQIGLVFGYIARGKYPEYIEECLSDLLHPAIGKQAARPFETFQDSRGRGLWIQGPAMDDTTFTHHKLIKAFSSFKRRFPDAGKDDFSLDDQPY